MIDVRLEPWIQSFSPESQKLLRKDLECQGNFEQQAVFAKRVQINRLNRMISFVDDLQKPFHIKVLEWLKSFI